MFKYQIGMEFYNYQAECCVIMGYNESSSRYIVKYNKKKFPEIWSESDIDHVMSKQDAILSYDRESKLIENEILKCTAKEIEVYQNVDGFCNEMSNLRKGKILSILNRTLLFKGRLLTRKEWISEMLKDGYKPNERSNGYVLSKGNSFFKVCKTEYGYAVYLTHENIGF